MMQVNQPQPSPEKGTTKKGTIIMKTTTELVSISTDFDAMNNGSYYTIVGTGGDLDEWITGYNKLLAEEGIGKPSEWLTFKGEAINSRYNLQGDNAFKPDTTFLVFPLDGLDVGKLAMFKLRMNDKWFDDLVANSVGEWEGDTDEDD
jgi:hypothetical protein